MDRIISLRAVADALPAPALIIAANRRVLAMNIPAQGLVGHDGRDAHYTGVLRQPAIIDAIEGTCADGQSRDLAAVQFRGAEEGRYDVAITSFQIEGARYVLAVFTDVSHVEGISQLRKDFVANVSHELRTPLTALMGFIETLQGPARDDPRSRERFLELMSNEASRMDRLIHDLLSLSRVEAQVRQRPSEVLDLRDVLREAVAQCAAGALKQGVSIEVLDMHDRLWVKGDRDQLGQVFRNLLENALKYGASRVAVSVTKAERVATLRGPSVIVRISDDGDGIEDHHVPRLTERFYRVDAHRSREAGGTGLGLAIVKHIIDRHRGALDISSTLGKGSTFSVSLPRVDEDIA